MRIWPFAPSATEATASPSPRNTTGSAESSAFQRRTVESGDPDSTLAPPAPNASDVTQPEWPRRMA